MLAQRVISAAIIIPIIFVAVYYGDIVLFVLVAAAALVAGYEYIRILRHQGLRPSYVYGLLLIAVLVADAQWPARGLLAVGLALIPLMALANEVFHGNAPGSLNNWALAVAGGIYVGFSLSHCIRLRALDKGMYWLGVAFLGTWICDTAAYFVGRAWGKHRFYPQISPKKTLEGAIAGLVVGIVGVMLLSKLLVGLGFGWGAILGLALVLGATYGDLAESVIKRQVGVKDSSQLIPGHGGMLDRADSLMFVFPIVYYLTLAFRALGAW